MIEKIQSAAEAAAFWKFAQDNPVVVMILGIVLAGVVGNLVWFSLAKICRTLTILVRGYPPVHCDVDGDAVEESTSTVQDGLFRSETTVTTEPRRVFKADGRDTP